jgi:hypothetical protein
MDGSHDVLAVTGIHALLDLPAVASFPALSFLLLLASLLLLILLQVTGIHTVVSAVAVDIAVANLVVSVCFSTWSVCWCSPAVAYVRAVAGRPC